MKPNAAQLRVSLGFAEASDHIVEGVAGDVLDNLWGNPNFSSVPFPSTTLAAARNEFLQAMADMAQGGTAATAEKNNKREALLVVLRQLASYVQDNCANDLAKLLSSGFEAVSTSRTREPLVTPLIKEIVNGNSGQLIVKVTPVKNAKSYEVRIAIVAPGGATGPFQIAGVFTDSRQMIVEDLTPGTTYMVQVSAIGGSTGQSGWSDPVIHMCM